jgi:hypothetical protein
LRAEAELTLRRIGEQGLKVLLPKRQHQERAMKYLCLAYYDEEKFNALPNEELEAIVKKCRSYDAALLATGKVTFIGSLSMPQYWKSIRPGGDKPTVTDGPFTEAKEIVGAFFIVEAKNLNEAVEIASKHPAAHLGANIGWGIDVKACEFFEQIQEQK